MLAAASIEFRNTCQGTGLTSAVLMAVTTNPGRIRRARGRIRGQIHRLQLGHPRTEHPNRTRPADPLGDHRRRHPRIGLQQFPDPWLDLINDRTPLCSSIIRPRLASQRRPDRVLRDPQYPGDHLDRQPLRPMQPANLSPIFHRQQPLLVLLARLRARPPDQGVKIRMPRRRQFSRAADMMVQRGFGAVNGQVEVPAGGRVRVVSCAE
jgi:hypothetical protein